jgi:hypothetical protein
LKRFTPFSVRESVLAQRKPAVCSEDCQQKRTRPEQIERMEGWLEKQGHMFKTWKRRWVVLENQINANYYLLSYFTDETKREKKGEFKIALDSAVTNLDDGYSSGKANLFVLQAEGNGKTFLIMSALTEEDKNAWILTIETAIDTLRLHAESNWQA